MKQEQTGSEESKVVLLIRCNSRYRLQMIGGIRSGMGYCWCC